MTLLLRAARAYGGDQRHDILVRDGRIARIAPHGTLPPVTPSGGEAVC